MRKEVMKTEPQNELFPVDPRRVQLVFAHVHWTMKDGQASLVRIEILTDLGEHREKRKYRKSKSRKDLK